MLEMTEQCFSPWKLLLIRKWCWISKVGRVNLVLGLEFLLLFQELRIKALRKKDKKKWIKIFLLFKATNLSASSRKLRHPQNHSIITITRDSRPRRWSPWDTRVKCIFKSVGLWTNSTKIGMLLSTVKSAHKSAFSS